MTSVCEAIPSPPVFDNNDNELLPLPQASLSETDGMVTMEYYDIDDESDPNFSHGESEKMTNSPSATSSSPSASSSSQTLVDNNLADFKTYCFMHSDTCNKFPDGNFKEDDYMEKGEDGTRVLKRCALSEGIRKVTESYYKITHQERIMSLQTSPGNFCYCPRGNCPDCYEYKRRRQPGPFLTCAFSQSHDGGDEFYKVPVSTKPMPELGICSRPPHFKDKRNKKYKRNNKNRK